MGCKIATIKASDVNLKDEKLFTIVFSKGQWSFLTGFIGKEILDTRFGVNAYTIFTVRTVYGVIVQDDFARSHIAQKFVECYADADWESPILSSAPVKTYKDWDSDLSSYLQPGDLVDEEMANYFINVMPPATFSRTLYQMGEPVSHVQGRATYHTVQKTDAGWVYQGRCHRGQTISLD